MRVWEGNIIVEGDGGTRGEESRDKNGAMLNKSVRNKNERV